MNDKNKIIRDIVRKESLRIMKESQASFLVESSPVVDSETKLTMKRVNDYIGLLEKNLDKLNNEEKSAMDNEDYLSLKEIKKSQLNELSAMIKSYEKKLELLNKQKQELEQETNDIDSKGAGVFKNQEINEFSNEGFEKGWGLKLQTPNYHLSLVKIGDHNAYKVMNTNIENLELSDLLQLPDLKIGGAGKMQVFRKVGDRHDNVAEFEMKNIIKMTKNPQ